MRAARHPVIPAAPPRRTGCLGWALAPAALAIGLTIPVLTPQVETSPLTARLPERLESYVSRVVKLTPGERARLMSGAPVTKLLEGDDSEAVGVFGAVWIGAPISRYVAAVTDIANFEKGGGFRITTRIGSPPTLDDFRAMHLPEGDVADLAICQVGDCDVKLTEAWIQRFRTQIDWNAANRRAAADALMRTLMLENVTAYLASGNDRLPVYHDRSQPRSLATEFREMTDHMPELTTYMPDLRQYLLEYPKVTLPGATSFLYWQLTEFGLKPTIRVSHLTIRVGSEQTVVASKMLYASHYFRAALELRILVPDASRGAGFWFVTVNRSRSDGLSGFMGMFVRPRVRSDVKKGTLHTLELTKQQLEAAR